MHVLVTLKKVRNGVRMNRSNDEVPSRLFPNLRRPLPMAGSLNGYGTSHSAANFGDWIAGGTWRSPQRIVIHEMEIGCIGSTRMH